MPDLIPWSNLLPQYQSPQQMAVQNANVANTNAQTGLLGAQTAGADIANQSAGLRLGLLQDYLGGNGGTSAATPGTPAAGGAPTSSGGGTSTPATVGGTNINPDDVTSGMIQKYAPIPTARPPQVVQAMQNAAAAGMPDAFVQSIGAKYDAQVQGINQQRQLGANATYQMAEQVASAPPGAAMETLARYDSKAAAALEGQHPSDDPAQLDADARLLAQHSGIAVHQYTGRDTDFQNGVLVDKKDGKPVLGSEQVLTGLDAGGKEKAFAAANELVTVQNSDGSSSQVPRWKQSGFSSAEGYVIGADRAARSSADNEPDQSAAPSGAPAPASTPPPAGNTHATYQQPPATPAVTDPALKTALSDPDYKINTPPVVAGRTPTPAQLDQQKATVSARTDLLKDQQSATAAASQALTYLQGAKQILDSGQAPTTGPAAALVAKASAMFPGQHIDATNYQEAAKLLANAALQSAHQNFPNMSTSEVDMQMHELSPSLEKTPGALQNLVNGNIKQAQYTLATAQRVRPYLATNGDPQSFNEWNEKHFQRSAAVNAEPAKSMPPTAKLGAYAQAHFGGDMAKAQAYLKSQGYQ